MNAMQKVLQGQNVNFHQISLNDLSSIETITLPFIPDSNSDVINRYSDSVLDKISSLTMVVSAGIGTFVAGYV